MLLAIMFCLVGCASSNKMVVYKSSAENRNITRTVYGNYFEGQDALSEGDLKVYLRADMIDKSDPLYGLKASMGALGPDDLYAEADISITFSNNSREIYDISLWEFYVWDDDLMGKRYDPIDYEQVSFTLLPNRTKIITINKHEIGHYCEKIFIKFSYKINDIEGQKSLVVDRVVL
jgi:hypothetical protein